MISGSMAAASLAAAALAACHAAPSRTALREDASSAAPSIDPDGGPPRVQLSWRLFATQRWLDGNGDKRESAVVELLVNGGVPARVELGRRDTAGCAVHLGSTSGDPELDGALASVDCRAARVVVSRSSGGEIRVVASDIPGLSGGVTATVGIPVAAEVAIDPGLPRVPDEALGP